MTAPTIDPAAFTPSYEPWRHGGWYTNVQYPSGACGCVSRNFADKKWRIVCDERPGSYPGGSDDHTYPNRDAAARAEYEIVEQRHTDLEAALPEALVPAALEWLATNDRLHIAANYNRGQRRSRVAHALGSKYGQDGRLVFDHPTVLAGVHAFVRDRAVSLS